jgi:hypothetical protein
MDRQKFVAKLMQLKTSDDNAFNEALTEELVTVVADVMFDVRESLLALVELGEWQRNRTLGALQAPAPQGAVGGRTPENTSSEPDLFEGGI